MDGEYQIAIVETPWGMCGLLGRGSRIVRFSLPAPIEEIEKILTAGIKGTIVHNKNAHPQLLKSLRAYFQGRPTDFGDFEIDLSALTEFQRKVLTACRKIAYGQTVTYSELAKRVGRPQAVRAVASALAANPIPLIIPCHRIVRSDGNLGGFSAFGGIETKSHLLRLEQSAPR